ncbi:MAG TPA: transcriptional regulator [Kofleriaceae bacterium]|jgi:HTH-type transcriptional regulator/antitoxin HigA|nr:transcriptional regulator [Kofleriaceae bacterium]
MTIKPIRTERDHAEALARIDEIFSAKPGTPEFDELDVLATLVDAYEKVHHSVDPPSPVEAIRFRMDQGHFTRAQLTQLLGGSAKVTEVLRKRRALSKVMIVRLHRTFAIPYESLLSDIEQPKKTSKHRTATKSRQSSRLRILS